MGERIPWLRSFEKYSLLYSPYLEFGNACIDRSKAVVSSLRESCLIRSFPDLLGHSRLLQAFSLYIGEIALKYSHSG